jgi:hypothetical protein
MNAVRVLLEPASSGKGEPHARKPPYSWKPVLVIVRWTRNERTSVEMKYETSFSENCIL